MKKNPAYGCGKNTDVPVVPVTGIQRASITTRNGNTLDFFYNADNDLFVVDLNDKNAKGGNELHRQTLYESILLAHCR